jgi:hypothetical protein
MVAIVAFDCNAKLGWRRAWVWWVCFARRRGETVDFEAGMGVGGFVLRRGASAQGKFCKLGHSGTFWDMEGKARRHVGTEWGPGGEGASADALSSLDASLPWLPLRGFVPQCLRAYCAFLPLCKIGEVMRFCEHFCAADFYKQGNCRGIWVKTVLRFSSGAIGFLVKGAQRARAAWGIRVALL